MSSALGDSSTVSVGSFIVSLTKLIGAERTAHYRVHSSVGAIIARVGGKNGLNGCALIDMRRLVNATTREAQSLRQPGVLGSVLWKVIGPNPQMAMIAGSLPSAFTPS
jgi:hypothetical protein